MLAWRAGGAAAQVSVCRRLDFTGCLCIATGVALLSLWPGEPAWSTSLALVWAGMVVWGLLLFRWRGLILLIGAPAALCKPLVAMSMAVALGLHP